MEGGAENLSNNGEHWIVTCAPADLEAVRHALEEAGMTPDTVDLSLEPTSLMPLPDEGDAKRVLRMLEAIDGLPDEEREAFDLVRLQGMTFQEAASIAGVCAKTAQRRLNRALILLSEQLGDLQ